MYNFFGNALFMSNPNDIFNNAARLQDYYNRLAYNNNIQNINKENIIRPNPKRNSVNFKENQKLMVVRHGERVDSYFGPLWIQNSFNKNGEYVRKDSNMPQTLIYRENPYEFEFDPPLTENGLNQAKIHGEELAKTGVRIKYMYCSPALRSIQTADKILEGMGLKDKVPIRIEIGLFELLSWQLYIPQEYPWIDKINLKNFGYNIDLQYKPFVVYENIKKDETVLDYYQRSNYAVRNIIETHCDDGNIMLVGHAPSLEGCTRLLTDQPARTIEEFTSIARRIPFLSIAQCEKDMSSGKWRLTPLLSSYEKYQRALSSGQALNRPMYQAYQGQVVQ